jgi:AcrR family transcriptional regulator
MPVQPSDPGTYARIRNAALESFASKGFVATSIRDVAAAAGVSPGLVQHHFGTKAGLRDAVNEHVIDVAVETFQDLVRDGDDVDVWAAMGDTTTGWVRDNAVGLRYLARALLEGDAEASRTFDALIEIARTNWLTPMARNRTLRPEADRDWAAIHVIVFNLASVLFESAISRHLPEPFFDPKQLQRWNKATTELYRRGLSDPAPARTSKHGPAGK